MINNFVRSRLKMGLLVLLLTTIFASWVISAVYGGDGTQVGDVTATAWNPTNGKTEITVKDSDGIKAVVVDGTTYSASGETEKKVTYVCGVSGAPACDWPLTVYIKDMKCNTHRWEVAQDGTCTYKDTTTTKHPKAVGGVWVPVDKFVLLAPYIALTSTILVATAATAIYIKRRNKKQ